jgi:hypothetical protein
MPLAIGVGLGAGLAMGALNAFMVIVCQLPSIIVTIGTLIFFRGLAQVIAGDKSIRVPDWFIGINKCWSSAFRCRSSSSWRRDRPRHRARAAPSSAGRSTRSAPTRWRRAMPASAASASSGCCSC